MIESIQSFWSCEADRLLAELQTGPQGLSSEEAASRAVKGGPRVRAKRGGAVTRFVRCTSWGSR